MSARVTATQPVCPPWCRVPTAQHDAEAHDRMESWYVHRDTLIGDQGAPVEYLTINQAQMFEEQCEGGEPAWEKPSITVVVTDDALSLEEGARLRDALTGALELAEECNR